MGPLQSDDFGETMDLVRRIKDGEQEAWEEFFRRYHDDLLFSIRSGLGKRLRGVLQSEDVFQSVALEAFRDAGRFEYRGKGSLKAFLHRMVQNKIRDLGDWIGAAKRAGTVPLGDSILAGLPSAGEEPRYFDEERFGALEACLGALPQEMREAIVLRKIEGLGYAELAERLGKTEPAARKLFSRAMGRLALLLTERKKGEEG
ncbi:MAG TPA: RNA polymerase sigma factor [Planctomycetes bacterium]|nr:RNA polymerase sigma factor [Planctomycetota bacterium]